MEDNEVWPPPIGGETVNQSAARPRCSRAATVLGVLSLALTLPSLLVFIVDVGNSLLFMHNKTAPYLTDRLGYVFLVLIKLPLLGVILMKLPLLGVILGICSWRSRWGKLSVACTIIHYGLFCGVLLIDTWWNHV